jgi:methyl-accepting chemotaxis protein
MSEERFDRLESLIISIATRMDTMQQDIGAMQQNIGIMQQDIDRRFDTMQQDIDRRFDSVQQNIGVMQQDIDRRFDSVQQDIGAIRTRIDAEGTMTDAFERNFTRMMQQSNETSQLSRDTSRDLGTVEERMDRVERQQRRANTRLNDLEDRP